MENIAYMQLTWFYNKKCGPHWTMDSVTYLFVIANITTYIFDSILFKIYA